ncbi:MAG: hypothetical protein QXJ97_02980 [Desulfurococcaceae archaeon]
MRLRLAELKKAWGFKTYEELLEYMVNTITSIVDPIVGREYTRLIKRVCREMGPTAVFYPRLLLKRYENGISEELKYYILARQNIMVDCSFYEE